MSLIKHFYIFLRDIIEKRDLIWELTKKDLKTRFAGTYLGIFWAFIQPAITIGILWFVFEQGFRAKPVENFPFILWLSSGMIPYFFFSDGLSTSTNSIIENSFLVKKVVFRVSSLPIVKILSALVVHLFFIFLLILMFALYGYSPTWINLQIFYYLFAMIVLLLGLSWITSALVLFFRDIGQLVATGIQILFWGTPIFWPLKIIPEQYQFIFKLNPLYYIINGYRDSLVYKASFLQNINQGILFWIMTLVIFISGALFFRKLRPHFADVL